VDGGPQRGAGQPGGAGLYQRVAARHPEHKAIAIGHALRKLLHLVFALWKSDRPFDANHSPWAGVEAEGSSAADNEVSIKEAASADKGQAAGHKPEVEPVEEVVTAACAATGAAAREVGAGTYLDFAHLKGQLPMAKVLDQLGISGRLRGGGAQRRCACPIHRGDGRGRTFSVNLEQNVFCCFEARCGKQGDVIDLWAAAKQMSLREAALDLVRTFNLEAAPRRATEKRDG
jgi:hypothetical protein